MCQLALPILVAQEVVQVEDYQLQMPLLLAEMEAEHKY
jgi:hypothetical protein